MPDPDRDMIDMTFDLRNKENFETVAKEPNLFFLWLLHVEWNDAQKASFTRLFPDQITQEDWVVWSAMSRMNADIREVKNLMTSMFYAAHQMSHKNACILDSRVTLGANMRGLNNL